MTARRGRPRQRTETDLSAADDLRRGGRRPAYARAQELEAKVKAGQLDRKLSWGGIATSSSIRAGPAAGHREALARAGRMMFSAMLHDPRAPKPEQKVDYVRGDQPAAGRGPPRRHERRRVHARNGDPDVSARSPEPVEPPLAELPKEWGGRGEFRAAERMLECQSETKKGARESGAHR